MLTEFVGAYSVNSLMIVNPLPPQAYTKENLHKAYAWLLTQPTSIKEMAATQEILISLYLTAQRNGEASLETPSIQNFKQELKSLANMMGDLQGQPSVSVNAHTNAQAAATVMTPPQHTEPPTTMSVNATALDKASLSAIHDVKQTLNLSSDTEALRALIALGYKQFKKI